MKKKIVLSFIITLLIVALSSNVYGATEELNITVTSNKKTVNIGDTFTVTVDWGEAMTKANYDISYNENVVELLNADISEEFYTVTTSNSSSSGPVSDSDSSSSTSKNLPYSGAGMDTDIMAISVGGVSIAYSSSAITKSTFTFKAKANGDANISLEVKDSGFETATSEKPTSYKVSSPISVSVGSEESKKDFSNVKFELQHDEVFGCDIKITGLPEDVYTSGLKLYLTSTADKPTFTPVYDSKTYATVLRDGTNSSEYHAAGQGYYIDSIVELNQDLYVALNYKELGSVGDGEWVVYGKKLDRYEEPKYNKAFRSTFVSNNRTQIVTGFTHSVYNSRKAQIKIGKITDASILNKIQNGDASGFADLLNYAKNNSGVYNEVIQMKENSSWIETESAINLDGKLEKESYYYLYVSGDTENGKYINQEAVTFGISSSIVDSTWHIGFYGSSDFKWIDYGSIPSQASTPTPVQDDTKAPTSLPSAGAGVIVFVAIGLTAGVAIYFLRKTNYYKDI